MTGVRLIEVREEILADNTRLAGETREQLRKRVMNLNPRMVILEVSCKTGSGIEAWINWLNREIASFKI